MELIDFNSKTYKAIYNRNLDNWQALIQNKVKFNKTIDKHCREICKVINNSGLAVTLFCCEGHSRKNDTRILHGYVCVLPKNKISRNKLIDILNDINSKLWKTQDTEKYLPSFILEVDFITEGLDYFKPVLVIRPLAMDSSKTKVIFWKVFTGLLKEAFKGM